MVIERKNRDASPPETPGPDLVDHLVKKSLEVNPALRQRRSTGEVLADLKKQAVASASPAQPAPAAAPVREEAAKTSDAALSPEALAQRVAAKRKVTVAYYLEQKAADYRRRLADIQAREAQLQAERSALQQETLNDVVDFLTVVTFGTRGNEARESLAAAGSHLQQLGLNDAQVLQALKGQ